ncbi:MAG: hypothetical protein Q7K29_04530 [Thermoleophilia bacterium]|nr:hypothetical protein [Thermoleophilia bacterium]
MKLDIGRIINGAIELIKNNPLILAPQIIAGVLTFIMSMLLADSMVNTSGIVEGDFDAIMSGINWGALAAFAVLAITAYLIAYGITIGMACDAVETGTATIGGGFGRFFSRIGHLIIAGILVAIIVAVGLLLCVLPGLAAMVLLMFTFTGIVYSRRDAMEGISGSIAMVRNNIPDALIFLLIVFGISFSGSLISNIFDIIPVIGSLAGTLIQAALSVFSTLLLVKVYVELLEPAPAETAV